MSGQRPFFSVIVSAYNAEDTIEASVNSILSQSFSDFELIIIDDGSIDTTAEILARLQARDSRLRVVRRANSGLTIALNRAIDLCSGQYIVRHDADDISLETRFAHLYAATQRSAVDLIFSAAFDVVEGKRARVVPAAKYTRTADYLRFLKYGNFFVHGTLAIRRTVLERARYDSSWRYAQDYELILRLLTAGYTSSYVSIPLYEFRRSAGSISSARRHQQTEFAHLAANKHLGSSKYLLAGHSGVSLFALRVRRELELLAITVRARLGSRVSRL